MTIKALDALQKGYQRLVNARIDVAILYAANLLVVLPFAYAFHTSIVAASGASLAHGVLVSTFDFSVVNDAIRIHRQTLGTLFTTATGATLAWFMVNIFLSGGIIATVRQDGMSVTAADFFSSAAAHCGRFLRLALIVAAGALLVILPLLALLSVILGAWEAGAQSEVPGTIGTGVLLLGFLLLLVPAVMVYDYARIDAVLTDASAMRRSAWRGLRFVYRRLGRTMKLQLSLIILFMVLVVVYLVLVELIGTASLGALLATVVIQQLFVMKRMGLRVFGFAAESALYRELNPEGGGIPGWDTGHIWQ